jgi:hypothetical protein
LPQPSHKNNCLKIVCFDIFFIAFLIGFVFCKDEATFKCKPPFQLNHKMIVDLDDLGLLLGQYNANKTCIIIQGRQTMKASLPLLQVKKNPIVNTIFSRGIYSKIYKVCKE